MTPIHLLALISLVAPVAAEMGPEQAILDAYLRPYDRLPDLPYCGRIAPGGEEPSELPPLPVRYVNGTNELMDEHNAWHFRHASLAGVDPFNDNNSYGDDFVMMHRMTILAYDRWRVSHGHAPVAAWDPTTPIPPEFRYQLPEACRPRKSEDPGVPLPTWLTVEGGDQKSPMFNYTALCQFPTMNRLGKELDEARPDTLGLIALHEGAYHGDVHGGVGGDMDYPETSMRDPVFWAWHKHLDARVQLWERACAHREPVQPESYMDGMMHDMPEREKAPPPAPAAEAASARATSSVGALGSVVVLLAALALRRRQVR